MFAALAVVAAAAGAVLVPVIPAHGTSAGLSYLAGWLGLAVPAVGSAELALARRSRAGTSTASGGSRTGRLRVTGLLATVLFAELLAITAAFARGRTGGAMWAAGGLMLALLVAATWRVAHISGRYGSGTTPVDSLRTCAVFAVAESCGVWLVVRGAAEGPLWVAWLVGCLGVALTAAFWLLDGHRSSAEDDDFLVFGSAAVVGVLGVVTELLLRGDVPVPGPEARAAVGWLVLLAAAGTWGRRALRNREWEAGGAAQLAGLAIPLASTVWAAREWDGWGTAPTVLLGISGVAAAAALLLVLQWAVLAWLDTAPSRHRVAQLVHGIREAAVERRRHYAMSKRRGRDRYPERERYERERYERERYQWERDEFERRLAHSAGLIPDQGRGHRLLHYLSHPLQSRALAEVHRHTALRTGLAIDDAWPRVRLIAPATVRRHVRRRERGVLACRLTTASALCTAVVWLFIAYLGRNDGTAGGVADALLLIGVPSGPLLLAVVAVAQGRRLLVAGYRAKSEAVDVLRYDLAQTMQLALPEDTDGMILLAPALGGDSYPSAGHPGHRPVPLRPRGVDTEPDGPAADMVERVRHEVGEEVRAAFRDVDSALAEVRAAVRTSPTRATLSEQQMSRLAGDIARSAAEPVTAHLQGLLAEVRAAIRTSIEETVTGPALTNFLGYLSIELDRRADDTGTPVRTGDGIIEATAGRRVNLVLSVVRDRRAQNTGSVVSSGPDRDFFVYETVRIEGGREAATVAFDAVVDSSTLTPLPQRRSLSVTAEVQTTFGFQLPAQPGTHEVWFQLYQAGRLIQVAALKLEATAAPDAAGPGEDTDGG
ncbi:hypothetical protein ACPF8X_08685 [Streptomyces sp. G35A]